MSEVRVRRQWNDNWRIGRVPLDKLDGLHWSRVSGGVKAPAPQPFIHAYVRCTDVEGEIAHSCVHTPPPHRVKVCLVKKDNREIWPELLDKANSKPR